MFLICETHPVPYHAAVYRKLAEDASIPVHVLYGSNFSVKGYFDREFCSSFSWDEHLLSGGSHSFVRTVEQGGAKDYDSLSGRRLADCIRELRPAAVVALGYYHRFDRAVIRAAKAQCIPLIFRGETNDRSLDRSFLRRIIRDTVLRRLYRNCASILYIGQRSREHYLRLGCSEKKLIFSPYCVDEANFSCREEDRLALREPTRRELGIAPDDLAILFSGKLCLRKGVDLIPEAVRRLPEAIRSRVHLIFLGEGNMRQKMEISCAKSPSIKVSFTGFQGQSKLSSFYHAADAHILPSRLGETWGLVVNEALLHGVASVVSDTVGCQPDLIVPGSTGEVFESDNLTALTEALLRLLPWQNGPGVRARCREQAGRYTVAAAAKGLSEVWEAFNKPRV
jgi:glycosyltransferase involved in cell wall biosynthesis